MQVSVPISNNRVSGEEKIKNRYTLKVYPKGYGREIYRVMEISGQDTLDALCEAIMDSFDFTMEHLYAFCMDNRMYSENCYQCYPMYKDQPNTNIKLDRPGLEQKQKLSLHIFDEIFGFLHCSHQKTPEGHSGLREFMIDTRIGF